MYALSEWKSKVPLCDPVSWNISSHLLPECRWLVKHGAELERESEVPGSEVKGDATEMMLEFWSTSLVSK